MLPFIFLKKVRIRRHLDTALPRSPSLHFYPVLWESMILIMSWNWKLNGVTSLCSLNCRHSSGGEIISSCWLWTIQTFHSRAPELEKSLLQKRNSSNEITEQYKSKWQYMVSPVYLYNAFHLKNKPGHAVGSIRGQPGHALTKSPSVPGDIH